MNKNSLLLLLVAILLASCGNDDNPITPPVEYKDMSYEALLQELNFARMYPQEYAKLIEETLQYYNGNLLGYPGEIKIITYEGKAAVEEAVAFLKRQTSCSALVINQGLNKVAQYHCDQQGPTGELGHVSPNGKVLKDRLLLYGSFQAPSSYGENIAYGPDIPRRIVIGYIVDDGVPDRGHRTNIYDTKWTDVGFGWGYHAEYNIMSVMDFAKGYIEKTI